MILDIAQIKKIRKQIGLTQFQFAKQAGISQSMVAKIESGRLDPTYSKVKKIEEVINNLSNKNEKTAEEIMNRDIITVGPSRKLSEIVKIMKNNAISQIPVLEKNKIVGMVSELSILSKDLDKVNKLNARDIMDVSPPIINPKAGIQIIKQLLRFYPLILIEEKGRLVGVITNSDLINSIV